MAAGQVVTRIVWISLALFWCHAAQGVRLDWNDVEKTMVYGIEKRIYPGCVALVGNASGVLFSKAFGNFTYGLPAPVSGTNPPMEQKTVFDLASVTKVLATTTATMYLYQHGFLRLDTKVSDPSLLGSSFSQNGKGSISILNLLLHNAGFPPDPDPLYWSKTFGCPETTKYYPLETFSCQKEIYSSLLMQPLNYSTGSKYVYSDLSMITLMYVIGTVVREKQLVQVSYLNQDCIHQKPQNAKGVPYYSQCYYEAFVRMYVTEHLKLTMTSFLPPTSTWAGIAPAWNDTVYRHGVIQGMVSDGNSYALGGIAGHAGLFSTSTDIFSLMHRIMFSSSTDKWINSTTVAYFTKVYNTSQSSRALGWDTNNYIADHYRGCGNFSSLTYYHTGYTGTLVCADPVSGIVTVLLTNRVYPDDSNLKGIHTIRQWFNNAVLEVLQKG